MSKHEKNNRRIAHTIHTHEQYKASWIKRHLAFSVEMISPRGKVHTCSSYQAEINKHLDKTIQKIREIIASEAA